MDKTENEKYELIVKNRFGDFWDLTVNAITSNEHTDDLLTNRETKVKSDLKLKPFDLILTPGYLDLIVTPSYEVSRTNEWERGFDYPISQQQVRDAKIKFDYQVAAARRVQGDLLPRVRLSRSRTRSTRS